MSWDIIVNSCANDNFMTRSFCCTIFHDKNNNKNKQTNI